MATKKVKNKTKKVAKKNTKKNKSKYYLTPEQEEYIDYMSGKEEKDEEIKKKLRQRAKDWGKKRGKKFYEGGLTPLGKTAEDTGHAFRLLGREVSKGTSGTGKEVYKAGRDTKRAIFGGAKTAGRGIGGSIKDIGIGTEKYVKPTRKRVGLFKENASKRAEEKIKKLEQRAEQKEKEGAGLIFGKTKKDYEKDIHRLKNIQKGKPVDVSEYKLRDSIFGRKVNLSKKDEKDPKLVNKAERIKARGKLRKDTTGKVAGWFGKRGKSIKEGLSRENQLEAAKAALGATTRTISRTGAATGAIGESIAGAAEHSIGPIQVFKLAFQRMSVTLKWIIIIVFLFVILFVPWGVFYYTGWAVAAGFMFLVSLIYWVFISFFNGIAYVLVALINMITRIIMGILIFIAEAVLSLFHKGQYRWIPDPAWSARFRPTTIDGQEISTPWDHPGFLGTKPGYALEVPSNYWYEGRVLMEASLIRYDQIANVPALMFVSPPEWQPWMYNILIVKILEKIPGLATVARAWDEIIGRGMSQAAANFVETSPPWIVILLGCTPFIIIGIILVYIYLKYRKDAELKGSGF